MTVVETKREATADHIPIPESPAPEPSKPKVPTTTRLAGLARWLGAGAVAASGLLYLLQGIEHIDEALRNWIYLGLMAVMVGGGVVCRLSLKDAKSARLFFALAVAVIPVQFAQLGGMIHELLATGGTLSWFDFSGVTMANTVLVGGVSLLLLGPVAYAGFSVLARGEALRLTTAFSALNGLLLIPARDSSLGAAMLVGMVLASLFFERRYFAAKSSPVVFRTIEGVGIRSLFLLPLAIAAVRFGLHVDALWGYCALAGLVGLALVNSRVWIQQDSIVEGTLIIGSAMIGLSWIVFAFDAIWTMDGSVAFFYLFVLAPVALFLLYAAEKSKTLAPLYRGASTLLMGAVAFLLLKDNLGLANAGLMMLIGGPLAAWGLFRKHREPFLGGLVITAIGFCAVIVTIAGHITVNAWLLFAGLGVVLVLVSSMIERHGKNTLRLASGAWQGLREWK
ncbi:MAG: hypothetical protein AAF530_02990 [Pseudomonadota bacterium]